MKQLGTEAGTKVDLHLVWTKVLGADTKAQAVARAEEARKDGVTHYWDEAGTLGKRLKPVLGIEKGALAWDVYLFFKAGLVWGDEPPAVAAWSHQLAGADPRRFFGGRLGARLASDFRIAQGLPAAPSPEPERNREVITIDPRKLRTVSALMLDEVLAAMRADLPEAERPAFDELAKALRARYAAREARSGFEIPKGIRLNGSIVEVPKPTCLPDPEK